MRLGSLSDRLFPGLAFDVIDTGVGIPEKFLPRIFEQFFRVPDQGPGKGVGLGLANAYGIVERHRGTIEVESTPGEGTVFIVTLPTHQPAPDAGQGGVAS